MTENSRTDVAAVWRGRIGAQAASGLMIADFCKQHPCSVGSFYHWKRRIAQGDARNAATVKPGRTESDNHRFVQVPAPAALNALTERTSVHRVELILPSGTIVRIPAGDVQSLQVVLKHLQHNLVNRGRGTSCLAFLRQSGSLSIKVPPI